MSNVASSSAQVIDPTDTYQLDSDEFEEDESDQGSLNDREYEALLDEVAEGFSEEQVDAMVDELKETGLVNFLRSYLLEPSGPKGTLRKLLLSLGVIPPRYLRGPAISDLQLLPFVKVTLSRILRRREKLPQYNTVDQAVDLLRTSKKIIVLSGAGISTSCGIPDFRSADGIYAKLQDEGVYDLDDPQQMFDIEYFRRHPEVFYSFAKQIYPSNFVPSPCHRWIKLLEAKDKLLRNYTQNIDTLETLAGVERVLQCHGSFATASCLRCKQKVPGPTLEPYIMRSEIPFCPQCRLEKDAFMMAFETAKAKASKGKGKKRDWDADDADDDAVVDPWRGGEPGIMKPDITFFGQALDKSFDECLFKDREEVDLLVIIGTSLKVAPVSEVLCHIPHSVPQIFINMTPVTHVRPDICLLGDADAIVQHLCDRLGWDLPHATGGEAVETVPRSWLTLDDLPHIHRFATDAEIAAASRVSSPDKLAPVESYAYSQAVLEGTAVVSEVKVTDEDEHSGKRARVE